MSVPSLREQVLATYELGPEAVVALVEHLVAGFSEQLERVATRVATLEAENAALRSEVQALRGQLGKDSHNSSKPPSSDRPQVGSTKWEFFATRFDISPPCAIGALFRSSSRAGCLRCTPRGF